jgi:hypothetical protein
MLHLAPLGTESGILSIAFQLLELLKVGDPAISNLLVVSCDSSGVLTANQRRGVTPFVTLMNLLGHRSWKSRAGF